MSDERIPKASYRGPARDPGKSETSDRLEKFRFAYEPYVRLEESTRGRRIPGDI
jgi:hypothetical protein